MSRIVVIGGGFAGVTVARALEKEFELTLIDTKSYFEFTPGILRTIVEPQHISRIQTLHTNYLRRARIVVGDVTDVNKNAVLVGKQTISYDYLVICAGSRYSLPIKEQDVVLPTRAEHLRACYAQLCKACEVLIIGGGLVGTELAAEIATHYSGKKITIVHAETKLIERNHAHASSYAAEFLQRKGVRILYNEFVVRKERNHFVTKSGKRLRADMAFLCTGIIPNFEFLQRHFSRSLNEQHQVKVNEHLQVIGEEHIFAAGDITSVAIEKTAQNAEKQANVAVHNIRALQYGRTLEIYRGHSTPIVISLGKWNGIFEHNGFVLTGIIPGIMKRIIELREMWKLRTFF